MYPSRKMPPGLVPGIYQKYGEVRTGSIGDLFDKAASAVNPEADWVDYARITEAESKQIKELVGIDVTEYIRMIDVNAIRHSLKQHGASIFDTDGSHIAGEWRKAQESLTREDFEAIPIIILAPDRSWSAGRTRNLNRIWHEIHVNGYIFLLEEVRTKHNRLAVVEMHKYRAEGGASAPGVVPQNVQNVPKSASALPKFTTNSDDVKLY